MCCAFRIVHHSADWCKFLAVSDTAARPVQGGGSGQLEVTWTGNPASNGTGSCTGAVTWPDIEAIDVLGLTGIDTSSVALMVRDRTCCAAHDHQQAVQAKSCWAAEPVPLPLSPAAHLTCWLTNTSAQSLTGNSATSATVGGQLGMGDVAFTGGVLSLSSLDLALDCPTGFRLSWGSDTSTAATATAG